MSLQVCAATRLAPSPAPAFAPATASLITGKVVLSQAGCSNADGSAAVRLIVTGLRDGLESAAACCHFLPWNALQGFQQLTDGVSSGCTPVSRKKSYAATGYSIKDTLQM